MPPRNPFAPPKQRTKSPFAPVIPRVRKPVAIPRGPEWLKEPVATDLFFDEPPEGWPDPKRNIASAHTSKTEWWAYKAFAKVFRDPKDPRKPPFNGGVDWGYQIDDPLTGGREKVGGSVVDFVIFYGKMGKIGVRVATYYWHLVASPDVKAKDAFAKSHLEGYMAIIDLYDTYFLSDPTGQTLCKMVADAARGNEWPSPLLGGTVRQIRPAV